MILIIIKFGELFLWILQEFLMRSVFHQISKHFEVGCLVFQPISQCLDIWWNTLPVVFVILLHKIAHIPSAAGCTRYYRTRLSLFTRQETTYLQLLPSNLFQQQVSATGEISKKTSKSALNRPEILFHVFTGQESQTLYKTNEVGNSLVDGKYCGDQIMQLFTHYCFDHGRKRSKY